MGFASNILHPITLARYLMLVFICLEPDTSVEEIIGFVQGPDFPTGGIINGRSGIVQGYKTGREKSMSEAAL